MSPGRPGSPMTPDVIEVVNNIVRIYEIVSETEISHTTVYTILHDDLQLGKLAHIGYPEI